MQRAGSIACILLSVGTLLTAARPVCAEEHLPEPAPVEQAGKKGEPAHPKSAKGGEHGKLDVFAGAADLALWTLVVFLLLLLVLSKYAWKPMLEGLRKREQSIHEAISEAERAREEAQRFRDQLQSEVNNAHVKVREILDAGRRDAERTTQEMVAKARAEIQTERDRLRREIATARDQALQELWNQTAQLATLISAKAIRKELSLEDHRRLVDEALGELREAGSEWQRQGAGVRA
jgi:F-type H+-transporting ATPase subunit b